MKWFTHDNDLHRWPPMQGIINELGWGGYGRALAVLETLAKYVDNDGKFQFALPLAKPMDIEYWAQELGQSVKETERMFDVFESVALIQPWRETNVVCAPMLGDRVDQWTKRKKKSRRTKAKKQLKPSARKELKPPAAPLLPEHANGNEQQHGHGNEHGHENENKHEHEHQHKHNYRATTELLRSVNKPQAPESAKDNQTLSTPTYQDEVPAWMKNGGHDPSCICDDCLKKHKASTEAVNSDLPPGLVKPEPLF